ncbi:MAG: hypothetical protein ACOYNI_04860 [Acidimicrobiia bacterium]
MDLHLCSWDVPGAAHDPDSQYVERFWLPTIGPTAYVTLRLLAATADQHRDGLAVDTATLAIRLGVSSSTSRHAPLARALTRLARFELIELLDDSTMRVRTRIPWLTPRIERRLPEPLRTEHGRERAYAQLW